MSMAINMKKREQNGNAKTVKISGLRMQREKHHTRRCRNLRERQTCRRCEFSGMQMSNKSCNGV